MTEQRKVVIVGAGAAARLVTKALKQAKNNNVHVTVIQSNTFKSVSYYQTLVMTKRLGFVENSTFAEIEGADETVYGVAVGCSDGSVAVQPLDKSESVKHVSFDILVCATGFSMPVITETPGQSKEERQKEIDLYANALTSGNNVVIAGGGAIGVELAGDLLEKMPEESRKGKVTIVSSSDRLLPDQPVYYGERVKEVLLGLGAEIIFSDRVTSHEGSAVSESGPMNVTLKSGKVLSCHAYVAAFGGGANTEWLAKPGESGALPSGLLNEKGEIVVDDYLQSTVYDKLYAIGAPSSRQEIASIMNIDPQSKVLAKNIIKPKSAKVGPSVEHAGFQVVGHDTFATFFPESMPMPSIFATCMMRWCGFPFNMLCPCFCLGVIAGPCDPMVCGYCCSRPEGKGTANMVNNIKDAKMVVEMAGFKGNGNPAFGEEMQRS